MRSDVPSRREFLEGEAARSFRAADDLLRLVIWVPSGPGSVARRDFMCKAAVVERLRGREFDRLAGLSALRGEGALELAEPVRPEVLA